MYENLALLAVFVLVYSSIAGAIETRLLKACTTFRVACSYCRLAGDQVCK